MDAFWILIGVVILYTLVILSFAFSILAAFFASRLSRITGLFNAWAFFIAGLALTAFEEFAFFGSVLFSSYSKVQSTVETITFGTFVYDAVVLVAIPALFFGAMFKLYGMFKTRKDEAVETETPSNEISERTE